MTTTPENNDMIRRLLQQVCDGSIQVGALDCPPSKIVEAFREARRAKLHGAALVMAELIAEPDWWTVDEFTECVMEACQSNDWATSQRWLALVEPEKMALALHKGFVGAINGGHIDVVQHLYQKMIDGSWGDKMRWHFGQYSASFFHELGSKNLFDYFLFEQALKTTNFDLVFGVMDITNNTALHERYLFRFSHAHQLEQTPDFFERLLQRIDWATIKQHEATIDAPILGHLNNAQKRWDDFWARCHSAGLRLELQAQMDVQEPKTTSKPAKM